jgi:hypothetical protein
MSASSSEYVRVPGKAQMAHRWPPALQALAGELGIWSRMGRKAHFWWRDDDACRGSRELKSLLALLKTECVFLAVVPGLLRHDLVRMIESEAHVCVLQHGWTHTNHAVAKCTSSEFPDHRPVDVVARELRAGQAILAEAFPKRSRPILVPPWHRCAHWILRDAVQLGFAGVSLESPPFPLLTRGYPCETNTEIDLCDWSRNGAFIGTERLEALLVRALKLRREWAQQDLPVGILSHHALMTPSDFAPLSVFLQLLRVHDAQWADAQTLFPV